MMRKLKIEMKTRGLWARLTALLVVSLMTTAQMNAQTTVNVSYVDVDGTTRTQVCTPVTDKMTSTWSAGWYVVNSDVTMTGASVTCSGAVNLILVDGSKLVVSGTNYNAGIGVSGDGNSLRIYGQAAGTGELFATGGMWSAGIGGGNNKTGSNITINGGTVTASGNSESAGIGGGYDKAGFNITINGGTVTANGGYDGAGIGGGVGGYGSNITINGGTVKATSGNNAAGIGGGKQGNGFNITINGGTVTATGNWGAGIGGGNAGNGSNITINGGTVTATASGNYASGIGRGYSGIVSDIYINANCDVKAGADAGNAQPVAHTSTDDLAGTLKNKAYVNSVPHVPVTIEVTTETELSTALSNVLPGDTIKLTADINLNATMNVTATMDFTLDLNGHVLKANATDSNKFSVITIASGEPGGKLTIKDSNPTAVHTGDYANLPDGGVITGGKGTDFGNYTEGGGIYVGDNASLTIESGTIYGNTATEGGGICTDAFDASVNITGGTISGNTATSGSGGIYSIQGSLTLGGNTVIDNNTVGGDANNVYLMSGRMIAISTETPLAEGAKIGVTMKDATGTFATGATADDAKYFSSDVNKYHVNYSEVNKSADGFLFLEQHTWKYVAVANVLYAYCEAESCPYYGTPTELANAVTDTLVANDMNYSGEPYNGATLVDGGWAALGLTAPTTIEYEGRGVTTYGKTTTPPTALGLYTASVTKSQDPTKTAAAVAKADFQIRPQITFSCDGDCEMYVITGYNTEDADTLTSGDFVDANAEVTAVGGEGFLKWTAGKDGDVLSTDNPYTFNITGNTELYGHFNVKINIYANSSEGGEVKIYDNKNGKYLTEEERQHIKYGTSVTIEATAFNESGFAFVGWFNKATGEYFSKTQTYTFDATESLELEARFTDQVIWIRVKKGN